MFQKIKIIIKYKNTLNIHWREKDVAFKNVFALKGGNK